MTEPKKESPKLILHRFQATAEWNGKRLREVLQASMPELSSRARLTVVGNGLVRRRGAVLHDLDAVLGEEGGTLEVDLRHGIHGKGEARRAPLAERMKVLFEDEHLVVVEKAVGVTVQPEDEVVEEDAAGTRGRPLVELLRHYWRLKEMPQASPILVQRLDRDTSGLLVVAKTLPTARELQRDLAARRVKRTYRAVVEGEVAADEGTWHTRLARGADGRWRSIGQDSDGRGGRQVRSREAISHFRVIERRGGRTMLELQLETGRTHQLRIHCSEAGHRILGDRLYGRRDLAAPPRKAGAGAEERLHLHAAQLTFRHPKTRKTLTFESPVPFDLRPAQKPHKPRTPHKPRR